MGGFIDTLAQAGKDVLESSGLKDEVGQLWSRIRPMQNEFNKSEAGKDLLSVTKDYIQNYQKSLQAGIDVANKLPKESQPHPMELRWQARNEARAATYGENDAVGAFLIHQAEKTPGMDSAAAHMHAQNLADFTASILHDTETKPEWRGLTPQEKREASALTAEENLKRIKNEEPLLKTPKSKIAATSAPFSSFKRNVSQSKETPVNLRLYPTYVPTSKLEGTLMNYAQRIVYPLVVLPHLGNIANVAISTPLEDLAKTASEQIRLGDGNEIQQIQKFAHDAGVFASTSYDVYSANYYGSRGLLSKLANDNVGKFVYKATHNPLFDPARQWQLAFTSSAGYHTALDMADRLVKNPLDKRAIYELNKMGIKPAEVIAQKGQLRPDQIEKAVWRFTDSKIFLDTSLGRAYMSRTHPMLRLALMYHSFVSREAQLLKEEMFVKPFKTFDWTPQYFSQIAQTVAVLGAVFPLVGLLTKDITTLARGDWADVHNKQDIDDLLLKNGPKAFIDQVAEDYSHTAAFGIATSYLRGGTRFATANAMLGPLGNIAARVGDDTIHPVYNIMQDKKPNLKPLGRDVLEYNPAAVDNLGKLAAHEFLPTKREEELEHPKPVMKFKPDKKHKLPKFKKF